MTIPAVVTQSPKDNQWYAEFKGANHETWYVSEGYPTEEIGVNSVLDFCGALGVTEPVHVKCFDKAGVETANFVINAPDA
jgi:hypothetical protein